MLLVLLPWERTLQRPRVPWSQFPTKSANRSRPLPKGMSTEQLKKVMEANKPYHPVGGRLKYFIKEWFKLISDPTIIDRVKGMHIKLD